MSDKLKKFLTSASERCPVWLDEDSFAFIRSDESGTHIWRMELSSGKREQLTYEDTRIWSIKSAPGGGVLYCIDDGGNECEQIYLLQGGKSSNLTENPKVRHFLGGVAPDGKTLAYASNERNVSTFDIWKKNIGTGEKKLSQQFSDNYNWPAPDALSPDGRYLLYNKLKGESDNALWMTDLETGVSHRVPDDRVLSAETDPAWMNDSTGFYLISDRGGDFSSVYYYDIATASFEPVYFYGWDPERLAVSPDGKYLAVTVNEAGYSKLHIYDIKADAEINPPVPPKGVLSDYQQLAWSPKGHSLLFTLTSGKRPEGIWLMDVDAESVTRLSPKAFSDGDEAMLAEPELRTFVSFDGETIPYWLYVPAGKKAANLPVDIEIHGGPEGQERPAFNDFIEYLVSLGIAVVAPNVRGSTGYGSRYTHLDDVEKRLDSVHDIDALVAHLIETGVADKKRLAVTGMSYGGFMTLSCAARYPGLWACAIDTVGMYNLVTFLENTAEYRRPHRESEYGTLAHDRETLYNVSPAAKIADIEAPLMIIQGRNDPRVPVTEAEQAAEALKKLGRTVEYICYDDEGHGIAKLKNRLDCYPRMSTFLRKYLLD